eukprot:Sspe_Gene.116870::Locus_107029_Transcript_1_1_Confidence_1.000_Length_927::g.116870::m.116870
MPEDVLVLLLIWVVVITIVERMWQDFRRPPLHVANWKQDRVYLVWAPPPTDDWEFTPCVRSSYVDVLLRLTSLSVEYIASGSSNTQSPNHTVPVLEVNGQQCTTNFANFLCEQFDLTRMQAALDCAPHDVRAVCRMLETSTVHAIRRSQWGVPANYEKMKADLFPGPLGWFPSYNARVKMIEVCWNVGIMMEGGDEAFTARVEEEVGIVEALLAQRQTNFLNGDLPGPHDATVFVYLENIFYSPLPVPLLPQGARFPACKLFLRAMTRHVRHSHIETPRRIHAFR